MARNFRTTTSVIGLATMIALMPATAWAQDTGTAPAAEQAAPVVDDGGEILVTAQRRAEASRDVPISVTSIDEAQLTVANVSSLADTVRLTPALRFDFQGAAAQPTIRGVGTAVTTSGGGPNVGIYVDGFFQSNPYTADFQLTRVESIQVLKGPQGTLFGRNTTGGAILVTTADPSTTTSAEFKVGYSRFDTVRAQAYATFGLTDRIAFDVEGSYAYSNGFQTNLIDGNDHIGQLRNWSIRTGLKFDVSDSVSILLRYTHAEMDDPTAQLINAYVDRTGAADFFGKLTPAGQAAYGKTSSQGLPLIYFYTPPGFYATEPGEVTITDPVSFRNTSDVFTGTIKADIGFADFTSYTQYRKDFSPWYGDLDATALSFFNINVDVRDETFSQEFLFNSKPGSRLQWTAGLNYFQNSDNWDVNASFGGAPYTDFGGSNTKTKSFAAFADLTYELIPDRFFVTAGARYSHDTVTDAWFKTNFTTFFYEGPDGNPVAVPPGTPPGTIIPVDDLSNDSITPRVVLRYKPDEDSSIYASYTRGYKAGILNVGGQSQKPVDPEEINAFEVGYKYDNRTFAVDLAGYYYDYKNLQVSSYQNGAAQIRNAASSEIYGIEGQVRYRVSSAFNVNAGGAWTHARYKSFPNAPFYSYCDPTLAPLSDPLACVPIAFGGFGPGALTQTTTDASGLHMQRAPEFTANLGASYGFDLADGRLMLSGNLYYSSSFFFDPSEQFRQKPYEVLALRAEWRDASDHYSIALFGDNVTNNRYQTQVLFNTLGIGAVWSPPITYGVQLGAKF